MEAEVPRVTGSLLSERKTLYDAVRCTARAVKGNAERTNHDKEKEIMLKSNGKFGFVPDPPEPEECTPENYDKHDCMFCVNEKECRAEWEKYHDEGDD